MSSLALKLIAENKASHAPFLDLGNCGLTGIPPEIAELDWLESVSFSYSWTEWDGQKWKFENSQNTGENNSLTGIQALRRLPRLRSVFLSGTQVSDLAPLAHLSSRQFLHGADTQV